VGRGGEAGFDVAFLEEQMLGDVARLVRLLATVEKSLVARMAQSPQAKSTTFKPNLES